MEAWSHSNEWSAPWLISGLTARSSPQTFSRYPYAALALTDCYLLDWFEPPSGHDAILVTANKALMLDPTLAEAHVAVMEMVARIISAIGATTSATLFAFIAEALRADRGDPLAVQPSFVSHNSRLSHAAKVCDSIRAKLGILAKSDLASRRRAFFKLSIKHEGRQRRDRFRPDQQGACRAYHCRRA